MNRFQKAAISFFLFFITAISMHTPTGAGIIKEHIKLFAERTP